jgi:hypothetical protein
MKGACSTVWWGRVRINTGHGEEHISTNLGHGLERVRPPVRSEVSPGSILNLIEVYIP